MHHAADLNDSADYSPPSESAIQQALRKHAPQTLTTNPPQQWGPTCPGASLRLSIGGRVAGMPSPLIRLGTGGLPSELGRAACRAAASFCGGGMLCGRLDGCSCCCLPGFCCCGLGAGGLCRDQPLSQWRAVALRRFTCSRHPTLFPFRDTVRHTPPLPPKYDLGY